jgi:uncharacterized protein YoxC
MAEATLDILIKARDDASQTLKNVNSNIEGMSRQFKIAGVAMLAAGTAITAALAMCVKAAGEEEVGVLRLSTAMRNAGLSYDTVRSSLEAWIDAEQQKTAFADDEQRQSLAQLIIQTGNLAQAQDLLTLAMDISAGRGTDLASSTQLISYALAGNWGMVQRLIPAIKDATTEEDKWRKLREMFLGQAETYSKTLDGQFKILMNNISDLKEAIGAYLLPTIKPLITWAIDLTKSLKNISPQIIAVMVGLASVTLIVGGLALVLGTSLIPTLWAAVAAMWALLSTSPLGWVVLGTSIALVATIATYVYKQIDYSQKMAAYTQAQTSQAMQKADEVSKNYAATIDETTDSVEGLTAAQTELATTTQSLNDWLEAGVLKLETYGDEVEYLTSRMGNVLAIVSRWTEMLGPSLSLYPLETIEAALAAKGYVSEQGTTIAERAAQIKWGVEWGVTGTQPAGYVQPELPPYVEQFQHGGLVTSKFGIVEQGEYVIPEGGVGQPIVINVYLDGERIKDNLVKKIVRDVRLQGGL